jgi:hypothetical protein
MPCFLTATVRAIDQLLKKLESLDVVLVGATHNDFLDEDIKGSVDGVPVSWADPEADGWYQSDNLIVVGGIDKNSVVSPVNPYRPWIAFAPRWNVVAPRAGTTNQYSEAGGGASFGECHVPSPTSRWVANCLP